MPKEREIELKLAIQPADVAAFRRLPLLREKCIGEPKRRRVFNVYFDTPAMALHECAMALRLRKTDGRWLQTLKTAGLTTSGLHQRGEWEFSLRAPQLDLALFRETPLAALPESREMHLTLKPVFTTDFYRTTWLIEFAPGQRVEVALDQGTVRCGDHQSVICEVEIELIEGGATVVFDVALALAGQIDLQPDTLSKAERGYRLFRHEPLVPQRARTVELKRKWSAQQAMQSIVGACLCHLDANVDGALASDDLEYIHQLRVALRRLRSAIRIFRPAQAEQITAELKWLTTEMGGARDWDVLILQTLPALLDGYGEPQLGGELMRSAVVRQSDARTAARAALASTRACILRLSLARWVSDPGQLTLLPVAHVGDGDAVQGPGLQKLRGFASREIRRRQRHLLRANGALAGLSAEARHRIRIDTKKLRYAVEFFACIFDNHRVTRYAKILEDIQDLLGEANDGHVAMRLVTTLTPPERFSDFARGWFAARARSTLEVVDVRLDELRKAKPF